MFPKGCVSLNQVALWLSLFWHSLSWLFVFNTTYNRVILLTTVIFYYVQVRNFLNIMGILHLKFYINLCVYI